MRALEIVGFFVVMWPLCYLAHRFVEKPSLEPTTVFLSKLLGVHSPKAAAKKAEADTLARS